MPDRPPNVVVFFTDQQRHDTTGLHGCPLGLTPNFDRVAAAGTHLCHHTTCVPVCGPARACLQTGTYTHRNGVYRNGIAPWASGLPTVAEQFRDAGYATGYIGKWHLSDSGDHGPVPADQRGGYEYWLAANALEHTSSDYRTRLWDADNQPHDLPGYRVDALTDAAIRFISEPRDRPFFLTTSYLEPHHQNHVDDYPPPDGYRELFAGRWTPPDLAALPTHDPALSRPESAIGGSTYAHLGGYFGMVKRLDEAFGRTMDALKSLGLLDNTVVVFTSDHACHFKTRNAEYKRSCHDSSIRTPGLITGPGFIGGGQRREPVSLLDIPPTILDAAGIDIPDTMQGRSVLRLLRGQAPDWPTDAYVQIGDGQPGRAIRTGRWKYAVHVPDEHGTNQPTYDTYHETHLYDLLYDPHELTNLVAAESHAVVRDACRQRLLARMAEAGEPTPTIVPPAEMTRRGQREVTPEEAVA
ncbi:MAG: sulfatase-like hydrolase/transferase [Planctomycetota bacterium]